MEETFLRVKSERDELVKRHNRDSTDGKTATVTEEIANLKTELKRQKAHYEAQFIEYVSFLCVKKLCSIIVMRRFTKHREWMKKNCFILFLVNLHSMIFFSSLIGYGIVV